VIYWMSPVTNALLFGACLWLGAFCIDKRFDFKSPGACNVRLKKSAAWWRKLLVNHNNALRYGALFSFWALFVVQFNFFSPIDPFSPAKYLAVGAVIVFLGAVYIAAKNWRAVVLKKDKLHLDNVE